MKFATIWTMPAMSFRERLNRTREWCAQVIAAHLPKRVRYWVTIQEISRATTESTNIPATPLEEILKKLDRPEKVA